MPKEPTISVADPPAESHDPRWLPGPVAGALRRLRGVPRTVLAGVLAVVLVAGLVAAQEVAAAGQVRHGVRVGGVELSGLTRVAATDRLRAAAEDLQGAPLALQAGDATLRPPRSRAGVELDVEASVAAAMEVGRGGLCDLDRFEVGYGRIALPWTARHAPRPRSRTRGARRSRAAGPRRG